MTNMDLNLKCDTVLLSKNLCFRTELNERYNGLCRAIRRKKKNSYEYDILLDLLKFIQNNWECVFSLEREDLVMVLNVVRLGRSMRILEAQSLSLREEYQEMDANYAKLR